MSADEGGLGAERLAELIREEAIAWGLDSTHGGVHSWRCDYPDRYGPCDCLGEFVRDMTAKIAPEVDRLRRERDEGRAEAWKAFAEEFDRAADELDPHVRSVVTGEGLARWLRDYAGRLRAALGDERAGGRERAARAREVPLRAPEHGSSPSEAAGIAHLQDVLRAAGNDWPTDWTYDSPAVRPTEHDDEEQG